MYQGKFASKDSKGSVPQHGEGLPREEQRPVQPQRPAPNRPAPQRPMAQQPAGQNGRGNPYGRPAAPQGRPAPQRPMPQGNPYGRPVQQVPAQDYTRPMQPQMPYVEPRKRHYGGLIFYIFFFMCLLAIYTFTYFKLHDLQDWLIRYEAAQPTRKFEEVFDRYFVDPDWGLLYDAAGIEGTSFEGKDAFVSYMEAKVGDQELTGLETSNGLSKDKKYIVRLGDEKLASFTLVDQNQAVEVTDIPDWQLGTVELFFERQGTYYVETIQGQQVTVNGQPLDENATIRISTTKANEYLPEGVSAPMTALHQVDGLMVKPQVEVIDAAGNPVEVSYNEETRTFTVPALQPQQISEEDRQWALSAIQTYAMYMSAKGGMEKELAQYFQRGTELFKTFTSMERTWNQRYADHSFSDEKVTDYVRYNENLFSARVSATLHLVRKDGTEKVSQLDQSMFFEKKDGTWKCFEMTAVDVSEPVEQVRLTFKNGDQILKSDFVDAGDNQVECPVVSAPEGKTFGGWMTQERQEDGSVIMHVVLEPDENGIASVPAEGLKPMELLPLFE